MLNVKIKSAQVHHSDVGGQSCSVARAAHSAGHVPNLVLLRSNANFTSIADGDDEDSVGVENYHLLALEDRDATEPSHPNTVETKLEEYDHQKARGDPGAGQRAVQRRRVHGEVPVRQQGHPRSTQHPVHQVSGYWRSQSYNDFRYQQEHNGNAVQEHQWVAYEQVEIAAALATIRTAEQLTSRFRQIEKHVEANFSHQQRGLLLSVITSESAEALEVQRHSPLQEATA